LRAKVTFSLADWIQADNAEGANRHSAKTEARCTPLRIWLNKRLVARLNPNGQYERVMK
jgi:hypothetical protein